MRRLDIETADPRNLLADGRLDAIEALSIAPEQGIQDRGNIFAGRPRQRNFRADALTSHWNAARWENVAFQRLQRSPSTLFAEVADTSASSGAPLHWRSTRDMRLQPQFLTSIAIPEVKGADVSSINERPNRGQE